MVCIKCGALEMVQLHEYRRVRARFLLWKCWTGKKGICYEIEKRVPTEGLLWLSVDGPRWPTLQGWVCVNSRSVNAVFLTQLINASRFQCMRINAPKRPVIPVILRYFLTKEHKILPTRRPVGALFPGVPVPVWPWTMTNKYFYFLFL